MVNLTWDPPADNGGALIGLYNIYRGQTDDAVNELIASTPILRFKDEPDRMGVTYYYAVTASNFRHESNQSGIKNTTVYGSPLEPVGFNAISGCSTVYLSWSPPDDTGGLPILGYIIYRGTGVGSPSRYDEVGNDTTYEDRTVENGKIYHYKVQAFNEMGTGEPTFLRTATPKGPPSEPIFFIVQAGDGEVRLDWGNPANDGGLPLQGYWVHRGTSEDSLLPLERLGMDTETYTDTGLNNGVAYYYAIRAFNLLGNGTFTRILDAMPVGLPGAPAELEAKESDGQVTLSWKQPLDTGGAAINFYELQRGTEMTTLGPLAEWDGTEYVDTGLVNGQIYHYRLRASNVVGVGPWSDVVSATPHRVPDEPAGLMATVDPGRIELIWTPPMDTGGFPVTSFHIYRGDDLYTMELYQEVDPWTTSYLDSEVEGGRTYHYMVTAVTDAGEGPPSAILSRLATGPPGSPLDLRAEAGDGQVTLTWAEPERDGGLPVTGYIVLKGLSELGLTEVANLGPVLGYTDTAVENDRTYHYAVVALNDAGDGLPSDIANATPRRVLLRPGPPLSLEAEVDGDEVALRWRSPLTDGGSPVLGYLVLRGSSPDDMAVIGQTGIVLVYVDRGLEEGTTYHYAVAARNMVGEGDPSGAEDVTIRRSEEVSASTLPILLILCACVVVAGVASTLSTESGRYRWALLLGPLTTRLKRDEVLDNKTRHALLGIIITSPGIHYQAIMREFDLSNGVAAYHLDVLERENYIRSVRDGRLKRFYSTDVKVPRDRRATPEELRHEILDLVISRPGVSQKEVVNELGIESDTVGYHLRAMVTDGTIKDERMGKYMTYYRET